MFRKEENSLSAYIKLRDYLVDQISLQVYKPGEKLISERQLAEQMGVSRMTAREALTMLQGEGIIYKEGRKGYFVSNVRLQTDPTNHKNTFHLISESGNTPSSKISKAIPYSCPQSLSKLFSCTVGEELFLLAGVCSINNRKICYEENYIKSKVFKGFSDSRYYNPISDFILEHYGINLKQTAFRARATSFMGRVAKALGVSDGTQGLVITRLKSYQGEVVLTVREFWITDAIEVTCGKFPK